MGLSYGGGGVVTQSCSTLCDPWTVAHQAPLSMEFPSQEYWREWPFPSPGDLSDSGTEPGSPILQPVSYWLSHQGSPLLYEYQTEKILEQGIFYKYSWIIHNKKVSWIEQSSMHVYLITEFQDKWSPQIDRFENLNR